MGDTASSETTLQPSIDLTTAFYDVMFGFQRGKDNGLNEVEQLIYRQIEGSMSNDSKMSEFVPILPNIFSELLVELKQEDVDFKKIARVIKTDPLMSAMVIETANRPFFRRTSDEIISIEGAVSNLGLSKVAAIIFDMVMKQMMKIKPGYFERFGDLIWLHSRECAIACQELAKKENEDAFLCYLLGLVHDIGKLVIFSFIAETNSVVDTFALPGSKCFKNFLVEIVNDVSRVVVSEWALPEPVNAAIKLQGEPPVSALNKILYQGNLIADLYRFVDVGYIDESRCFELLLENDISEELARSVFAAIERDES